MGPFRKFPKTNLGKIWKSDMLQNSKGFHQHARFSKEIIGILPKLKQPVTQTNHIKSLIFLMAEIAYDTQLKQDLQIYTKFLSSSSYSCLPIKVCESAVYAKRIVQPLDTHYLFLFVVTCSHQNLQVKIRFSQIFVIWKRFHNPPATQEIKL